MPIIYIINRFRAGDVLYRVEQGAILRAILPVATAYGEQGTAAIPSNSAVIYDIALVIVKPSK